MRQTSVTSDWLRMLFKWSALATVATLGAFVLLVFTFIWFAFFPPWADPIEHVVWSRQVGNVYLEAKQSLGRHATTDGYFKITAVERKWVFKCERDLAISDRGDSVIVRTIGDDRLKFIIINQTSSPRYGSWNDVIDSFSVDVNDLPSNPYRFRR